MLSGAPSPSCPQPQHRWQRQGQGERERQEQQLRWLRQQQRQQQQGCPDVALLLQSLDQHHLDVAKDAYSAAAAGPSTIACPTRCTGIIQGSQWSLLCAPTCNSTAPAAGRITFLVSLDGHMGSAVIGQLLQHHGLDSPGGHRLGHGHRRLQPHHLICW
jgi:hypothetical protein